MHRNRVEERKRASCGGGMAASKINNHYLGEKRTKKEIILLLFFYIVGYKCAQEYTQRFMLRKSNDTQNKAGRNFVTQKRKKNPKKEAIKFILFGVYNFSVLVLCLSPERMHEWTIFVSVPRYAVYHLLLCVQFQFFDSLTDSLICCSKVRWTLKSIHIREISVNLFVHKPTGLFLLCRF